MIIKILGSGQDGGIPQTGCHCTACNSARQSAENRRMGPSIAIMQQEGGRCHLIDASPDFKYQVDMLMDGQDTGTGRVDIPVNGIILTHAHYGHCTGLLHLGKEVLDARGMPVYCTGGMAEFLSNNPPYSLLVRERNIKIVEIFPGRVVDCGDFQCTPFLVPHRNEVADTVGFLIAPHASGKRIIYIPDIDCWTEEVLERLRSADIALIDGTFYSRYELPRFDKIPHPPINETIELLEGMESKIYFTHINHTNPVNVEGREREDVEGRGFRIAHDGMILGI